MNSFLIYPEELVEQSIARVPMARLQSREDRDGFYEGAEIRYAVLNGKIGTALVRKVTTLEIEIVLKIQLNPPTRGKTYLVVAVPRPQTVKKVLQLAGSTDVSEVHFLRTSTVTKSYLQSNTLLNENINASLYEALEQVHDSVPPKVAVHNDYREFCSQVLPRLTIGAVNLMAENASDPLPANFTLDYALQPVVLAVGPESGWAEREYVDFTGRGFMPFSLGPRILRVETALALSLGMLSCLRNK